MSLRRLSFVLIALGLGLGAAWLAVPVRAAGPWYVTPGGSDGNSCLSPAAPCGTINGAIAKAVDGDSIRVAAGTFQGTGAEVVLIDKNVHLTGGWNPGFTTQTGVTVIDGQDVRRGIEIQACSVEGGATTTVERFKVTNGYDLSHGAGVDVDCQGANVLLRYMTLSGNKISGPNNIAFGGGLYARGVVTVSQSTIDHNIPLWTTLGTAILNMGILWIQNTTISDNPGYESIYNFTTGSITMTHSTLKAAADNTNGLRNLGERLLIANSIAVGASYADVFQETMSGYIESRGYSIYGRMPVFHFATLTDLVGVDAGLLPLQDNGGIDRSAKICSNNMYSYSLDGP